MERVCPEACWGRQAYPWWDDSDLSPTSDFLPCSANCTATKLDSKQEKLVWLPVHSDQHTKTQSSSFKNNGQWLKIALRNETAEWLHSKIELLNSQWWEKTELKLAFLLKCTKSGGKHGPRKSSQHMKKLELQNTTKKRRLCDLVFKNYCGFIKKKKKKSHIPCSGLCANLFFLCSFFCLFRTKAQALEIRTGGSDVVNGLKISLERHYNAS